MTTKAKKAHSVAQVFGFDVPKEVTVEGYDQPDAYTPTVDQEYHLMQDDVSLFTAWYSQGRPDGLYISGDTGTGKTTMVSQICARLNISLISPPVEDDMTFSDLIGQYVIIDGDTVFQEGPLTLAMRYGNLLVLNEGDAMDPSVMLGIHAILEGEPLVISQQGGMRVEPAEGFGVVITGNSQGAGDLSGNHSGVKKQNIASMDRFWMMKKDYLPSEIEQGIVEKMFPSLDSTIVSRMVEYANIIRNLYRGIDEAFDVELPQINVTFSTRSLLRWAKMTLLFSNRAANGISPIHYALDRAIAYRALPECNQGMHDIAQRIFGEGPSI